MLAYEKKGLCLIERGGQHTISVKFYPCDPNSEHSQSFVKADLNCQEILRTSIAYKAIKHATDKKTVVINCQDWAHRETLKNPIKRFFYMKFKTDVRADFFIEIWNEHLDKYTRTHQDTSLLCSTTDGLDAISEDQNGDVAAVKSPAADKSLGEIGGDADDDYGLPYAGNYSDEDELFEETQPTTEPFVFDLKKK